MRLKAMLGCAAIAMASNAFADYTKDEEPEITKGMRSINEACQSKIAIKINYKDFEGKGSVSNYLSGFFWTLRRACQAEANPSNPHPEGIAFIQKNLKTITIKPGPDLPNDKMWDQVRLATAGTDMTVTVAPLGGSLQNPGNDAFEKALKNQAWLKTTEVDRRIPSNTEKKTVKYSELYTVRRIGDVQLAVRTKADELNKACGSNIEIVVDNIPTWQAAGYLISYPDMNVGDYCTEPYFFTLKTACEKGESAKIKKLKRISCQYGGPDIYKTMSGKYVEGRDYKIDGTSFLFRTYPQDHPSIRKQLEEYFQKTLKLKPQD